MKKNVAVLLAVLMTAAVLMLSGCGNDRTPNAEEGIPAERAESSGSADRADEADAATTREESAGTAKTEGDTTEISSFRACSLMTEPFGELKYWLYTPSDPTEDMPLIVYLHGGSGKGDDLELITAADGFPQYLRDGKLGDVRAYVVIPQLPSSQKGWANAAAAVRSLIQATVSEFDIDKENISLTGHSMGGTGTWDLALAYPTLFSKIAPLSGSIRNIPEYVDKLKNIPVWAFVGSEDTIVPPASSIEFVAALKKADGKAAVTVFDGADHFAVPSLTYPDGNTGIIDWLTDKADCIG